MLVREVMTEDVVTVPADATLEAAVGRMLDHDIGSVVAIEDGHHVGIVTETDVLNTTREADRPLGEVSVESVMSAPVITIGPDATVRAAIERMRAEHVKKLPVADDMALVGILSEQDVVYAEPDLHKEAIHLEERRLDWEE